MPKPVTAKTSSKVSPKTKGKLPDSSPSETSQVLSRAAKEYKQLEKLLKWCKDVPDEWVKEADVPSDGKVLTPLPCDSYKTLIDSWRKALRWREDLDDVLSFMLSVALSTMQQGDQLFGMVIGDAGSGKTRLCDAMLVSPYCYPLEHITGFFSGFKGGGGGDDDGDDYSLINRVNGKLMITPEGDVLMSNPKFAEIMAQQRRIFDGASGATYKNKKKDMRWTGLRTPWIIAGTPTLLETDQSRLGDRFLKIFVESPTEDERQHILRSVSRSAFEAVRCQASGEDHVGASLQLAYQLTGGYVGWLRENNHLLSEISVDDEYFDTCELWGDYTSYLRARPGKGDDSPPTREQPTRLTKQFVRLMCCTTVVLNRTEVDTEVMRRLRRSVLNTSAGVGYDICKVLYENDNNYLAAKKFQLELDYNPKTIEKQIKLMKQIGALRLSTEDKLFSQKTAKPYWRMSPRMYELFKNVEEFKP